MINVNMQKQKKTNCGPLQVVRALGTPVVAFQFLDKEEKPS